MDLDVLETQKYIKKIKDFFQLTLAATLNLTRVSAPLFVLRDTGLNDQLNGYEKAISFDLFNNNTAEIVHSLAKWKRFALNKYKFPMHTGLYTDMNAIRKDEVVDNIHSYYVDQWDWEYVISSDERTLDTLLNIVNKIYSVLLKTEAFIHSEIPSMPMTLPEKIYFITSQELEDMYPNMTSKERENAIVKEYGAVFLMQIGGNLKSGKPHDGRSPDYDDWKLDGDLLIYDKVIDKTIEISSMGVRVDEESLKEQLEKADCMDRIKFPYHQQILKKELPYSIGGGIGLSRVLMLILEKEHIAEVQASSWGEKTEAELKDKKVL